MSEPTIIDKDFNPDRLGAGLYITAADTPAYPTLTAMKVMGDAKVAGISFEPDGTELVAFKVGGGQKNNPRQVAENPRMQMSQRWLQNAVLDYADWKGKIWREFIQNSVDAKAKNIKLSAGEHPDGTWTISCEDDGGGMDLDILLNKFLVLGGTTKEGGTETSGGFGKAKEMLILPWISWSIHSRDAIAVGAGDIYTVYVNEGGKWQWHQLEGETKPEFQAPGETAFTINGTIIKVLMPSEKHTDIANAMAYVEKCNLPRVKFWFWSNNPSTDSGKVQADLKNGRLIKEIGSKAVIYYMKSGTRISRCLIRTREGLFMFDEHLPYDVSGYVVVELLRPSIELLTSNRDSIADSEVRQALRAFLNDLAANTKSALNAKKNKITEVYTGAKFTAYEQKQAEADMVLNIGEMIGKETKYEIPTAAGRFISDAVDAAERKAAGGELELVTNKESAAVMLDQSFSSRDASEVLAKQLIWKPAFIIHNDIETFRVPIKFKPQGMTPSVLRLIKVWTEFCRFVMTQLGSKREWGVGFIFSDDAKAALYTYDGTQWLVVNPFKSNDQEIYNPNNEADRNLLYAMAIHECTHIANNSPDHNESFSTALTINMALCTSGAKKIKRIVASVPLRGQAEFEGDREEKRIDNLSDDELLKELRENPDDDLEAEAERILRRLARGR